MRNVYAILVIFRGVPAFRPLYLENYGSDLHEIYNSYSQFNMLCHNTFRVAPFSVVFEKKILKFKLSQKCTFVTPV